MRLPIAALAALLVAPLLANTPALAAVPPTQASAAPLAGDPPPPSGSEYAIATRALAEALLLLPQAERARVTGVYVAVDDDASEVNAYAACDDDGDYVVVLTLAMMRLVDSVALARAYDEARGTRFVEELARYYAGAQRPGARLLPPPPGLFDEEASSLQLRRLHDARARDALAFLVTRELLHGAKNDLVCPHPTPTREPGDGVWTADERRAGLATARRLAAVGGGVDRGLDRDAEAVRLTRAAGRTEAGILALFDVLAASARTPASPVGKAHAALHAEPARRAHAVRVAAAMQVGSAL
jgi:hypothetical protein